MLTQPLSPLLRYNLFPRPAPQACSLVSFRPYTQRSWKKMSPLNTGDAADTATSSSSAAPRPPAPIEPLEGLLAINKPSGISSGEAIRKLVTLFTSSRLFAPTLDLERQKRAQETRKQRHRRRNKHIEVKVGHGGTLDPMASGVLVLGINSGTKQLQSYLTGTKTYVADAMCGCSTDTYDAVGKILRRAPHAHITKEKTEEVLELFRGEIMQKPPLYSALHHEGKRYYEYAREGKELPIEIQARPVRTDKLELIGFTREHEYKFPEKEASEMEKTEAEVLEQAAGKGKGKGTRPGEKREREEEGNSSAKKIKMEDTGSPEKEKGEEEAHIDKAGLETEDQATNAEQEPRENEGLPPPVATIVMTVSKGFYVRSLVHDLGHALDSAAHMVKLVRLQQGPYELGKNVLDWELLDQPEEKWGPEVESILRQWKEEKQVRGAANK